MTRQQFYVLPGFQDVKTELIRKSIHFLIAVSPGLAALNREFTVALLCTGTLFYTVFEVLRLVGVRVPLVSQLTAVASRPRDEGHFVMGPVTLGVGALLAFLVFPPAAAAVAVYALAFGDGLASLAGKLFGCNRPDFLHGKSVEGSLACFMAVYFAALQVSGNFNVSIIAALTASMTEVLPLDDYDNIAIPLVVGMAVTAFL